MTPQSKVKPECLKCRTYTGNELDGSYRCQIEGECPGLDKPKQKPWFPHDVGERWLRAEKELDELKDAVEVIARICGYEKKQDA